MTVNEISDYFDVVIGAHQSPAIEGVYDNILFNEYEKSVFLTSAQEEFVSQLYNGTGDFDVTEQDKRYLNALVRDCNPEKVSDPQLHHIDSKSVFYKVPDDAMFIIHEQCVVSGSGGCENINADVYPCSHDEFNKIRRNPFRGSSQTRVLRIDTGSNDKTQIIELVPANKIKEYKLRYIKIPDPVILIDLDNTGLLINGETKKNGFELPEQLHKRIVEHAAMKALMTKQRLNHK